MKNKNYETNRKYQTRKSKIYKHSLTEMKKMNTNKMKTKAI